MKVCACAGRRHCDAPRGICHLAPRLPLGAAQLGAARDEQAREFKPVTEAMLLNPDPADWPNWRRTLDGWGYSPLNQINKQNVHQLQLAWSWGLRPGRVSPRRLSRTA